MMLIIFYSRYIRYRIYHGFNVNTPNNNDKDYFTPKNPIDILKASGFKNHSIMWHYLSYGFWMVLIGSVLGLILEPMVVPKFLYPIMKQIFILPSWNVVWSMNFVYMTILMIIMSLAVSFYSAKSISDESPS
ncbi:MAG: FtsX-like permease family protein [Methanobrevibacter sp.]|nr:FtsX-like permease family protein [Methanobrevibacter sp.]